MRIDSSGTIWKVDYFACAAVGETFHEGGNEWRKRSTRTAEIVKPCRYAGTWFYFRRVDRIERALQ